MKEILSSSPVRGAPIFIGIGIGTDMAISFILKIADMHTPLSGSVLSLYLLLLLQNRFVTIAQYSYFLGNLYNEKRSKLNPERAEMLLSIKYNKHLVD